MARIFNGNWACKVVEAQLSSDASADEIAKALATHPEFIAAVESRMGERLPGQTGSTQEDIVAAVSERLVAVS